MDNGTMRYPSMEPELWRSLSEQERGQRQFQYVRKWALVAAACRVVLLMVLGFLVGAAVAQRGETHVRCL